MSISFSKYSISSSNFPAAFGLEDIQQLSHFTFRNKQGIVHTLLEAPQKYIIRGQWASADGAFHIPFRAAVGQGRWVQNRLGGSLG